MPPETATATGGATPIADAAATAGGVLFVHAHPDDEAFATGGSIARAVAEGRRVDLVTCTGGEEGEIHDPSLDEEEAQPRLREIRERELACALDALRGEGPGELHLHLLGYRDSGMMGTDANERPDAFWNADLDEATGRVVEIVRRVRPEVIVSYDPNGNYGHPDHINAHRVAAAAWEAAADPGRYPAAGDPWEVGRFYEIAFNRDRWFMLMGMMRERGIDLPWDLDETMDAAQAATPDVSTADPNASAAGPISREERFVDEAPDRGPADAAEEFGTPEDEITTIVDVSPFLSQKRACMSCHRTQWQDMGWVLEMPQDLADMVSSPEHYVLTRHRDPAHEAESQAADPRHADALHAESRPPAPMPRESWFW